MVTRMRVLVAYDGSDYARAALDDLRRAGLPGEVEAVVFSVADVLPFPPADYAKTEAALASRRVMDALAQAYEEKSQALVDAHALAREGCERLRTHFPAWEVRDEAAAGTPAWEVIHKAERWKVDLVVMGSHGRSALGRIALGSVSQKVSDEAPCTVRVTRGAIESGDAPPRLLIGVDESSSADAAVDAVARRAWPEGSTARVITVVDPARISGILPGVGRAGEGDDLTLAQALGTTERAAEKLRAAGLKVTTEVEKGDPPGTLLREAARWEATTIFVGARRFEVLLQRWRLGSVSAAVVTAAPCPVEVVRAAGRRKRMKVPDVMTGDVVAVKADTTVEEIARLLMERRISGVPVLGDAQQVIGIVSESDLFLKEKGIPFSLVKAPTLFNKWADTNRLDQIYKEARRHTAADVMTRAVRCVDAEADIGEAAHIMLEGGFTQVPVTSGGKLIGIISRVDLIRMLADPA